jgi:methionyl-tRNA synthetase
LQATSPWALAKVQDLQIVELHDGTSSSVDLNTLRVERCVFHAAEAIRIVGILLQPYMPEKAAELLDMLGVEDARRSYDDAVLGADDTYGTPKRPVGRDVYDALFPPLPVED